MEKQVNMWSNIVVFIKIIGIVIVLFVIIQYSVSFTLGGNLVFSLSNESQTDSLFIDVYLDGERVLENVYTNEFTHNFKSDVIDIGFGKHVLTFMSKDGSVHTSVGINAFFVTWIGVEIYNSTPRIVNGKYHVYIYEQKLPLTVE